VRRCLFGVTSSFGLGCGGVLLFVLVLGCVIFLVLGVGCWLGFGFVF